MNDCIFCKIVRGAIPAIRVFENQRTLAFLDIQPVHPGHVLVVAKNAATGDIFDISPEDWTAIAETVRMLAGAVERATGADGINILMNNRAQAGQVIQHAHVHIIPRFNGDGLEHWCKSAYKDGEAERVQEKIRAALSL